MIEYRSIDSRLYHGKKYELTMNHNRMTVYFAGYSGSVGWARLDLDGRISVKAGYRWDGASGAVDSADFMEGSMYHDILCELIESGQVPSSMWNKAAAEMREINKAEGMPWLRRWWTWRGVRLWGLFK